MSHHVELRRENFRTTVDGRPVDLFTLRNRNGMVVRVTNYGAKIEQLLVPDRNGTLGDVVQGYETIEQVMNGQASMGSFIGRYCGRIAQGRFLLDGVEQHTSVNNPPNTLHGGTRGSRFRVFDARQLDDASLELTYVFQDGEEGFPGTLPVRLVYSVDEDNALTIAWTAVAVDKTTVANFTDHTFFNLSGDAGASILDHVATVNGSRYLALDATGAPTGELVDVTGTPHDFRSPTALGARIDAKDPMLAQGKGYDLHYVVDKPAGALAVHARVLHPASGRTLEVRSTEPGIQLYTGNFLEGKAPRDVGKGNTLYTRHSAFCLEPSHFPNSVNVPSFPSTVLKPGQWYAGRIVYAFGVS
ncbi:aldose epimerase family protein [Azospirillum rugosum]|uniref:Aldose 1-epimerase n=1 Tax=Azospirillum rugosum TaxID=416170 RepID=A0ABS4SMJ7_9PROT|nr:aldose epimerase family protein [Azospirillum rugosum]MBP2293788.1 aldose 1-epimerase [Azospirillum rugosum]MDQ0527333.1 aldose 1-epimerase [Azospirillum rugosum]